MSQRIFPPESCTGEASCCCVLCSPIRIPNSTKPVGTPTHLRYLLLNWINGSDIFKTTPAPEKAKYFETYTTKMAALDRIFQQNHPLTFKALGIQVGFASSMSHCLCSSSGKTMDNNKRETGQRRYQRSRPSNRDHEVRGRVRSFSRRCMQRRDTHAIRIRRKGPINGLLSGQVQKVEEWQDSRGDEGLECYCWSLGGGDGAYL